MGILSAENVGDGQPGTGPIGLLLILALAVATILLIRNMNARLRRLPERFPAPPPKPPVAEPLASAAEPAEPPAPPAAGTEENHER